MTFTLHNEARVELMLYWAVHVPADEWIAKIVLTPDAYENYLDIASLEVRESYEPYLSAAVVGHSFRVMQGRDAVESVERSVLVLTEQIFETMLDGQAFTMEQLKAKLTIDMHYYADSTVRVPDGSAWRYWRNVLTSSAGVAMVQSIAEVA